MADTEMVEITRVTERYVELLSNHWTRLQFLNKWHKAYRNSSKMKNC